jgi:site-specific DNA-cytosine methylase
MRKRSYCLFTGLGGANAGLQQAGYEDLGGVEINPNVAAIHDLNFECKVSVGM